MNFILIKVTKVNQDLPLQIVRTPDLAELEIPVSITWMPAWKVKRGTEEEETPQHLIEYLNSGGEEGVKTILQDIVEEKLREWGMSSIEGPQNFIEAMGAREEAVAILLKAILGDELETIPSEIPTVFLMKYLPGENKYKFNDNEREDWENKWAPIYDAYSDEKRKEIKKAVERRQEDIRKARQGNGWFLHSSLGIILNRLNVGEIKPVKGSKLERAMELAVAEREERRGEAVELEHVATQIRNLMKPGLGFSKEQAQEIVQTERGKVQKRIIEYKGLPSGVVPLISLGEGKEPRGKSSAEEKTGDGSGSEGKSQAETEEKTGSWPALAEERARNLKKLLKQKKK